ncbi:MAG: hypothetical protein ABSG68_00305 [Thermoguttaceae bacterium]|jgi:phenylacetate-CoA ligase
MPFYQKFVRNVLCPLDRWRSGDAREFHYLREFERSQYLSLTEVRELQFRRLKALLEHASRQCPFYRRQFDAARVAPGDVCSLDDLQAFPVLEKRHIQEHRDEMIAANWPRADLIPNLTGGSTGTPISFFLSRDRAWTRKAATWRHNRWAGWDLGDKVGSLWGAARDLPAHSLKQRLRNWLLDRTVTLNTALITEERLRDFHARLKKFRPKVLVGYANSLRLFAQYVKCHGLAAYQPHSIISTAEVLEPTDRALIEDVFGCRTFNRYGCREVSVIASECVEHSGMHIMAEGLYVEVVCGDRPAQPGEAGAVLVTDLLNLAMPLIRYRIGDMATPATGPCRCGRGLPRLEGLQGRATDFLVGADGRLVSGAALTVVMVAKRPGLGQVQIWQDTRGKVLFKIVKRDSSSPTAEDLGFLDAQTRLYLGQDVKIEHEFVDSLPSETSGKFLFCRSSAACDFVDLQNR